MRALMIVLSCLSLHLLPDNWVYRIIANAFLHFKKHCAKKLTDVGRAGLSESLLAPLGLVLPIPLKGIRELPLVTVKSAVVPQSLFWKKSLNLN